MKTVARIAAALAALALAFAAITWLALEQSGVAIAETRAPDGSLRRTHVWSVELDGRTWLEAGKPTNPWFADLQRGPHLRLTLDGVTREARAEIDPHSSATIRAAMRPPSASPTKRPRGPTSPPS